MRKRLLALLGIPLLAAATSCTPREIRAWQSWHAKDPAAAEAFARQLPQQRSGAAASDGNTCAEIRAELLRQGASSGVASHFATVIAPRESGCSPQYVHDSDDWSYSRFGLNAGPRGENVSMWRNLCGADVRSDTRNLSVDVRCALAAYNRLGWSPWS